MGQPWVSHSRLLFVSPSAAWSLQPNLVSFNSAISSCEAAGEWQVAVSLLESIGSSPYQADLLTYNSLISASGKSEQWQLALFLFHQLPRKGLTPDVVTFSAAISAMEKNANGQHALALLAHAKQVLAAAGSFGSGPNMILYSAAISACEKSNLWEEALSLLSEAKSESLAGVVAYNSAISACGNASQWETALLLLYNLETLLLQPDVVTFSAAISACESSRQWEVALSLFTTLREWQSQLDTITYGSIISACEKGKAWEEALLLFQYMLEDGVTSETIRSSSFSQKYPSLRIAHLTSFNGHSPLIFQPQPLEDRLHPDIIVCNSLISSCYMSARWSVALDALQTLQELVLQASALWPPGVVDLNNLNVAMPILYHSQDCHICQYYIIILP